jgi:hypothetical protein
MAGILGVIASGKIASGGGGGGSPLITAQTLGTVSGVFNGWVGCKITVGGANITVSQLARWVISGNSAVHALHIRDSAGAVVVVTSVNNSGAPAAAYLYAACTPTVLTAGQVYYIMSEEANGGDSFYDGDTTVTSVAAVTVENSVYSLSGTGVPSVAYGAGFSYGPLNATFSL